MAKVYPVNTSEIDRMSKQAAKAKAQEWREKAIRELRQAGSRLDYNVGPIIESFTEVRWSNSEEKWYYEVRHSAAGFMNFGTDPHLITPDQANALRWVTDDGEEVFAMKSDHPGTPAIMFMEKSRERTLASREDIERRIDL